MNEGAKTGIFLGVAVVMVAIATFVTWPRATENDANKLIGKQLFPDFEDPLVAASMKIVTYDDEQGTLSQFEVAKDPQSGIWKIPTHAGYPADAEEQMRSSATALFDLTILDVPSRNAEDHAQYGVLEPDPENLKVGDEGVGRLVDFRDEQGEKLATLIVGNEVPNLPQQRYVRKPTQDVVYVVELDESPLSTRFVDWIDKDLLGLTAFDIERVTLNNYTASFELGSGQVSQNKKFEAELRLEGADWELERLVTFKDGVGIPEPLDENETLNKEKLNDLKQALDELEIADVGRKPEGMSASLKADKSLISDQSALLSLLQRGFIPVGSGDSEQVDILAANGELVVTQKNGVEYVLRFGDSSEGSGAAANSPEDGEAAPVGSNRYLLVTARVNEAQIPPPDLESLPETIEELDAAENAAAEPQDEEDPAAQPPTSVTEVPAEATDAEPAGDAEAMQPEDESATPADTDAENPDEEAGPEDGASEETATDEPSVAEPADDAAESGEEAPDDQELPLDSGEIDSDDVESDEAGSDDAGSDGAEASVDDTAEDAPAAVASDADAGAEDAAEVVAADDASLNEADPAEANEAEPAMPTQPDEATQPEETEQEKQERLEAAQERITKENQRKLDERQEKIQQARQRVAELNARFADWYYEISETTFRDLRLPQEELIISKEDAAAGQQPGAAGGFPPGGGAFPQFGPPGGR